MADRRRQLDRRWLWLGAAIILIVVFFSVRSLTRDRLAVRVAEVAHQPLASTVSTNGRVEPVVNYEMHSPIATTVKAVYVQPGDEVAAGKLLMELDDAQARARLAAAESGVKSAQAALDAVTHNGTQEQRQMAAADVTRSRLDRDQARRDVDALIKLNSTGAASSNEVAAARQRLESAEATLHAAEESARSRYSSPDMA
ncbi:MAG: efflux RND transporter periplasmic adaptor subunit, partial [Terracidiphilus sp.]